MRRSSTEIFRMQQPPATPKTNRFRDDKYQMRKVYQWVSWIDNLGLELIWHFVHFIVAMYYFVMGIIDALESHLISQGLMKRYKTLNIGALKYLAIVFDDEEAHKTSKIVELLLCVAAIGVKHVCLFDREGVLKKSKNIIMEKLPSATLYEDAYESDLLRSQTSMTVEFASRSDGKETVVKAANLVFMKYMKLANLSLNEEDKIFTEAHMDEALRAVGCRAPKPDLLFVYGPVRCHQGFPAWRLLYTEIVYMGPLKSMRYGSLIKAIHRFTKVRQNYGA